MPCPGCETGIFQKRDDRMVIFKSADLAEELVPLLADKMDTIGYNLEHGPANDPGEQAAPVESVRRIRELADEYGVLLAIGPDRRFALSDGLAMAEHEEERNRREDEWIDQIPQAL